MGVEKSYRDDEGFTYHGRYDFGFGLSEGHFGKGGKGGKGKGGGGNPFRNICQFAQNNQCPQFSKYIEQVIPINEDCPAADTISPWGFIGREDEESRWGGKYGGFQSSVCSVFNPTGTTVAPSTLKACSYCRPWGPSQTITALAECNISCVGTSVNCACGASATTTTTATTTVTRA